MEQPLSSLAYRGSVVEAITEAKRQKKLFVVYIAGDNVESGQLETSTWKDPKVRETTEKYCILLHILEGSSEASNFAAIYPQKGAPCITAVGYNGVQLWQNDGFVSADVLASSLEKAWLSLHVQETTAAFLTAALASKNQVASSAPEGASSQQVTSVTNGSSSSRSDNRASPNAGQPVNYDTVENMKTQEDTSKDLHSKKNDAFHEPNVANMQGDSELDGSMPKNKPESSSRHPTEMGQNNPEVDSPVQENNTSDHQLGSINEVSHESGNQPSEVVQPNMVEITSNSNDAEDSDSYAAKSNDVFLSIRLPDGVNLQAKFSVMDTLEFVKDYISQNQGSNLSSFSIAIPYPRKVFTDQDMNKTLSELGFFNRQALVVVQQNNNRGGGSSQSQTYTPVSSIGREGQGYWASIKGILSYANPFSYFGGGSSSTSAAQESPSGIWQYSPNSSLQTTLRGSTGNSSSSTPPTQGNESSSRRQQTSSRFGGNIHTLKHDEDDDSRFSDRNTFWNGNSTQFGGNDDGK